MASFSNDVKEELCSGITDLDKMYACLYGAILYCRNISEDNISFSTESLGFAELLEKLFKSVFKGKISLEREESTKKKICVYGLSIKGKENICRIFTIYNIQLNAREIDLKNIVNNSLNSFLAGIFFVCGSVSNPYKEYRLEFNTPSVQLAEDLYTVLLSVGIDAKITERKNGCILYVTDSENIEDILTFIGARQSTIDLMNIKIYKDVRNKVNRIANCDSANIDKVVEAARKQIDDINIIKQNAGLDSLSQALKEAAEIRLENPEYSLSEIGELMEKPIGRSGVVKRFQRISIIAEEIRKRNRDKPCL